MSLWAVKAAACARWAFNLFLYEQTNQALSTSTAITASSKFTCGGLANIFFNFDHGQDQRGRQIKQQLASLTETCVIAEQRMRESFSMNRFTNIFERKKEATQEKPVLTSPTTVEQQRDYGRNGCSISDILSSRCFLFHCIFTQVYASVCRQSKDDEEVKTLLWNYDKSVTLALNQPGKFSTKKKVEDTKIFGASLVML